MKKISIKKITAMTRVVVKLLIMAIRSAYGWAFNPPTQQLDGCFNPPLQFTAGQSALFMPTTQIHPLAIIILIKCALRFWNPKNYLIHGGSFHKEEAREETDLGRDNISGISDSLCDRWRL